MGLQYKTFVILYTLERRLRNISVTKKKGVSHVDIRGKTYQVKKKKKKDNWQEKKKIQQWLKCDGKRGGENEFSGGKKEARTHSASQATEKVLLFALR